MSIGSDRRPYRRWGGAAALSVLLLALAVAGAACFGDGNFLGDQETSTPTPTSTGTPGPTGTGTPTATVSPTATITATPSVSVTPVTPFEITVKEAVNIRAAPSTNAALLRAIFPGEKKKVIGEARGEEVEPGQGDLWYALEGGGFVYAPFVVKVQA